MKIASSKDRRELFTAIYAYVGCLLADALHSGHIPSLSMAVADIVGSVIGVGLVYLGLYLWRHRKTSPVDSN